MLKYIQSEPVMVQYLVQSVIGLVSAFGFHLTAEQTTAIMAVTGAVVALIARQNVIPTVKAQGT